MESFAPIGRTAAEPSSAALLDDYTPLYSALALPISYFGCRPDLASVELFALGSEMEAETKWSELFLAFCGVSKLRDVDGIYIWKDYLPSDEILHRPLVMEISKLPI